MKTLVVGNKGSIGKRYSTILTHLKQSWEGLDVGDTWPNWQDFTHGIICTPSDMHLDWTARLSDHMNVLVEKPLTNFDGQLAQWKSLKPKNPVYMVNNYSFLNTNPGFPPRVDKIEYNFFNTGKDGTALDCVQLIFLADKIGAELEIKKDSPIWDLWINDKLKVPYEWIEWSYVQMINAFLHDRTHNLWPLAYGIKATELAFEVQKTMEDKHAGFHRRPNKVMRSMSQNIAS